MKIEAAGNKMRCSPGTTRDLNIPKPQFWSVRNRRWNFWNRQVIRTLPGIH